MPLILKQDNEVYYTRNLKDEKMLSIYETFEKPMIKILAFMEIEGIKIDNDFLKLLSSKFEIKIKKIQKEVFKISKTKACTLC